MWKQVAASYPIAKNIIHQLYKLWHICAAYYVSK